MEPVEVKVEYKIHTRIAKTEEKFRDVWVGGFGKDAQFKSVSNGWFILFEGSGEFIYLGREKPTFEVGDRIEIVIRRKE